ncbi:hypothetical protein TcasGA2_TC034976 [Tribolium castaneum]|uniref:Uncharacterized protein n=1 Tax=Tribolium castaneum TaxID=7070 RepID=A0A139W9J6_TRICA|nr:hypothetical protein TcasGA2_TC034976 [Tribolium castaneum]
MVCSSALVPLCATALNGVAAASVMAAMEPDAIAFAEWISVSLSATLAIFSSPVPLPSRTPGLHVDIVTSHYIKDIHLTISNYLWDAYNYNIFPFFKPGHKGLQELKT